MKFIDKWMEPEKKISLNEVIQIQKETNLMYYLIIVVKSVITKMQSKEPRMLGIE